MDTRPPAVRAWMATGAGSVAGMAAIALSLVVAMTAEAGPPPAGLVAAACATGLAGVASTLWGYAGHRRLRGSGAGSAEACTIAGALCLFAAGAAAFPYLWLAIAD